MGWFRRRGGSSPPEELAIGGLDLFAAIERVQLLAQASEPVDVPLLEARIADLVRDAGGTPVGSTGFAAWSVDFDESSWRRVDLAVGVVADLAMLPPGDASGRPDLYAALQAVVGGSSAVGLELLATSEVRAEEFARRIAAGLSLPIHGETPGKSRRALERLDYGRLLALVDEARASAEDRMARLQELQRAQDSMRRRGKF